MSHGRVSISVLFLLTLLVPSLSGCLGGDASDWAYRMTGLREVQERYDGSGIVVAIVDTGIDPGHPSLDHATVVAWKDFIDSRPEPYDDVGHGSHVAGIVVGEGADFGGKLQGFSLHGAAPQADLIVVKAIRASDGRGSSDAIAGGISFSVQKGADVICLSLGRQENALDLLPEEVKSSIENAARQGILVVAAAGNDGEKGAGDVATPGSIDVVIAVGAVDQDKKVPEFSNRGSEDQNQGIIGLPAQRQDPNKKPEVVAPGVGIKSAWKNGDFAIAKGTSQAVPFVCGALALLLQHCPSLRETDTEATVQKVKDGLMRSSEKLAGQRVPHDNQAGYGLLRADALLEAVTC